MPTTFLDRKEASIFKQLVGGDPLWADLKLNDGRRVVEGNFPIILACNGKPKIWIDEDADAWLRRLVVLSFKTPSHEQHFGKMAELILKTELSGILNWLLEGRAKLVKDKLQLIQMPEQKERAAALLLVFRFTKFWEKNIVIIREKWSVGIMINKEWLEPRLA